MIAPTTARTMNQAVIVELELGSGVIETVKQRLQVARVSATAIRMTQCLTGKLRDLDRADIHSITAPDGDAGGSKKRRKNRKCYRPYAMTVSILIVLTFHPHVEL